MVLPVLAAAWLFGQSNAYDPITAFRNAHERYLRAQTVGDVSGAFTEMVSIRSQLADASAGQVRWAPVLQQMDQLLAGVQATYRQLLQGRDSHGRSTAGLPVSANMGYGVMRYQQAPGQGTIASVVAPALGAWTPPDADPRRPGRQRPRGAGPKAGQGAGRSRGPVDTRPRIPGVQPPRRPRDARPGVPGYQPPRHPRDARPGVPGIQPPRAGRRFPQPVDTRPDIPGMQPGREFCERYPGHPACRATDAAPNVPGWQPQGWRPPGAQASGIPGLPEGLLPGLPPFFPPGMLPPGLMPTGLLPPGVPSPKAAMDKIRDIKDEVADAFSGWSTR